MRYVITGGSGFLGNKICQLLHSKGFEFINLDIKKPSKKIGKCILINLNNIVGLKKIIKKNDIVIHCSAAVPLNKKKKYDENYNTTKNIADVCLTKDIKKFIYVSSSAVCGLPDKNPFNEFDKLKPIEPYGLSKKKSEKYCLDLAKKGLPVTIIRPRTIMGLGRLGIFSILFDWIEKNKNIPVLSSGLNMYQFIDVEDCAECIFLASNSDVNDIFNIGSKDVCSIKENITNLIKFHKSKSKIKSINSNLILKLILILSKVKILPFQDYQIKAYAGSLYFDNKRAMKLLNWKPKYNNKETLLRSFEYYILNKKEKLRFGVSIQSSFIKNKLLNFINFFLI